MGGAPFGVAVLSNEVSLDFEQEVVLGLVCEHERGPAIAVGLPSLVLPLDAAKADCGGGFADLLQAHAGSFWSEMWVSGAWVRMEPFLHVSLILVLCGLVSEHIGYFAVLLVISC